MNDADLPLDVLIIQYKVLNEFLEKAKEAALERFVPPEPTRKNDLGTFDYENLTYRLHDAVLLGEPTDAIVTRIKAITEDENRRREAERVWSEHRLEAQAQADSLRNTTLKMWSVIFKKLMD